MPRVCWAEEGDFRRRRRRADMSGGGARGIWHAENRFISITLVRLIARVSIGSLAAPLILSGDPRAGAGAQERPVCPCLAVGCLGLRRCPRPACLLACFFALLVVRPHVVTPLASNPRPCALQARSHLQSSASSVQKTSFISVPGTRPQFPLRLGPGQPPLLPACALVLCTPGRLSFRFRSLVLAHSVSRRGAAPSLCMEEVQGRSITSDVGKLITWERGDKEGKTEADERAKSARGGRPPRQT